MFWVFPDVQSCAQLGYARTVVPFAAPHVPAVQARVAGHTKKQHSSLGSELSHSVGLRGSVFG